jgi:hypothetical protein
MLRTVTNVQCTFTPYDHVLIEDYSEGGAGDTSHEFRDVIPEKPVGVRRY